MLAELMDVSEALERNEVIPFFQPIVELRTGQVSGFEVLARWNHPLHGPVLPSNFIALAEEHGWIEELTYQVVSKAFLVGPMLPDTLKLSVNLSAIQLHSLKLPVILHQLANDAEFSLDRLVVEVTETALLRDLPLVQVVAGQLKTMGCNLSLDDFGTGFSSLRHLQALPFDELKIDRSFVSEMTKRREDRKIVAAIVGLGQSLGLATVAEGVETEEQSHMLLWLGCELGQGWRYGRPVGSDGVPDILALEPTRVISGLSTPGEDWATSNLEALPTLRLAQLQAIYDGAPVGLCFLDRKMRYVSLNKRLADLNGRSVEAHLGRTVEEILGAAFSVIEPYLVRALKGEAITGVAFTRPSTIEGNGNLRLLASYQPAWDEADEVIGVSISVLDMTDSSRSEIQLPPSVEQVLHANDTRSESPWVMDAEGNDLQSSSRWVRTTPLGKDKTRNLRWLEAVHAEDLERIVKTMRESLSTGSPINIEYRVEDLEGEWRWMRSTGSPRYSESGEITRWYGTVEDIHHDKGKSSLAKPSFQN